MTPQVIECSWPTVTNVWEERAKAMSKALVQIATSSLDANDSLRAAAASMLLYAAKMARDV